MSRSGITHAGLASFVFRRCSAAATAAAAPPLNAGERRGDLGPGAGDASGVNARGSSQSGLPEVVVLPPPPPPREAGRKDAGGPGILLPGRLVGVTSASSSSSSPSLSCPFFFLSSAGAGCGMPGTGDCGEVGASRPSSDLTGLTSVASTQAALGVMASLSRRSAATALAFSRLRSSSAFFTLTRCSVACRSAAFSSAIRFFHFARL